MSFKVEPTKLSGYIRQLDQQQVNADQPIPDSSFFWAICGARSAGKSTLILSLLDSPWGRRRFHNLFWVSQTWRNDVKSKAPLKELIEELQEEDKVFDDLTDEVAQTIIDRLEAYNETFDRKKNGGKPPRSLIIIDDCLSSLPRNLMSSVANRAVCNGRHIGGGCSVIVAVQKYTALPVLWRQNLSLLSMFPSANRKDFEALTNDLTIDEAKLKRITDFCWTDPRSFLHCNFLTVPPTFYRKFDRIVMS